MIYRYQFGTPVDTDAVQTKPAISSWNDDSITGMMIADGIITFPLNKDAIVYGLGENVRGMNKRGFRYVSYCSDNPNHTECVESLYAAHNFILINSAEISKDQFRNFGMFVDVPGKVVFDIGYSDMDTLSIIVPAKDFDLYIIVPNKNDTPENIVQEFRKLIGPSYVAPKWAFGYGQSRWGYKSEEDIRTVAQGYKENALPLDMIYLDIDYMESYKDFTVDQKAYPDLKGLSEDMKSEGIHLVPIIDAGVKIEPGYDVYEEGIQNNYFVKDADGENYVVGVWPGDCHFPDFLDENAREWFGSKYKILLDMGIEGFWNDMNEPAIFYSKKHLDEVFEQIKSYEGKSLALQDFFDFQGLVAGINNNSCDYNSFYHNYLGKRYLHDEVHNLFGFYMTRGASEAFEKICPDKRILLFSRSSCIGSHRYGGIWTGDNHSMWSHLLMNLKMMPSLNMCGFLYSGADMGGFGCNTTEDLLLRWTAFSMFTPLMRNHSALGTREQEFYQFKNLDLFRNLLHARYRMVPYLYSEYMKAIRDNTMMFKPLSFIYTADDMARRIEDQLMIGNEIMIAPVVEANAIGRIIYFPEDMREIRFESETVIFGQSYTKGYHFINIPLGTSTIYLRNNREIPIGAVVESVESVDSSKSTMYSFGLNVIPYELYDDDGITLPKFQ